jgi:LysM repeat protein
MSSVTEEAAFITFSAHQHLDVRVMMISPPKLTVSGSKWETIDRPRKAGMTLWRGRDPVEQAINILFDGYLDDSSQDVDMSILDSMARPTPSGGAPPVVHIDGAVLRRDITDWIIASIDWGDDIIRDVVDGSILTFRQDAVVTLREFIPPDELEIPGTQIAIETTSPTSKGKPKHKFHKVAKGETLLTIATDEYGDVNRWRDIAKANNIRDPNHLKGGTVLRLP